LLFSASALLLTAWLTYALLRSIDLNSTNPEPHPSASTINESLDEVHLEVDQLLNELQ
jgi:hypothetical protein